MPLPGVRKKILYLDQFFFSSAFRAGDERFLKAANRIARLCELQLLVVPYSSVHEEETHQWEKRKELWEFIKSTSRGMEFEAAYNVERKQILKAFNAWLSNKPPRYELERDDALSDDIDTWDGYLRVDVGRYIGDIEFVRNIKKRSIDALVSAFPDWQKSQTSFDEDVLFEYRAAGEGYLKLYIDYFVRLAGGDLEALIDSPIACMIVESMLYMLPEEMSIEEKLKFCKQFFESEHFREIPGQWIDVRIFATLKAMVKEGAYRNRERALERLSGFFFDVKHISSYAPYVHGFVMDQPMSELVAKPSVDIEKRFSVEIFSLNNWPRLFSWLDNIEANGMTEEHKFGLKQAYPYIQL